MHNSNPRSAKRARLVKQHNRMALDLCHPDSKKGLAAWRVRRHPSEANMKARTILDSAALDPDEIAIAEPLLMRRGTQSLIATPRHLLLTRRAQSSQH